jgi:hypothetical protein
MPIIPVQAPTNYQTINHVMNVAKVRLNDNIETLQPVSGKLLGNTIPFSQAVVNAAWHRVQEHLGEKGYDRLIDECIIQQFPICASTDPASQCWINWQGCFDGQNFYPQPALPQFFNHPLKIWERWSGLNAEFTDPPMQKILNGLPAQIKTTNLRFWEWRSDTLFTPGSQMLEDMRIRHISFLADFDDVGGVPWFQQVVPIMRCSDGFAWLICAEIATARGDNALADLYTGNGQGALDRIFNLDVQADQQVNIRRQPRTGIGFGRRWY